MSKIPDGPPRVQIYHDVPMVRWGITTDVTCWAVWVSFPERLRHRAGSGFRILIPGDSVTAWRNGEGCSWEVVSAMKPGINAGTHTIWTPGAVTLRDDDPVSLKQADSEDGLRGAIFALDALNLVYII